MYKYVCIEGMQVMSPSVEVTADTPTEWQLLHTVYAKIHQNENCCTTDCTKRFLKSLRYFLQPIESYTKKRQMDHCNMQTPNVRKHGFAEANLILG